MKVLVVGSLKGETSENFAFFAAACTAIGAELATKSHTVVVSSDSTRTADHHIVSGIASRSGSHEVVVHFPEDGGVEPVQGDDQRRVPYYEEEGPIYTNIAFTHRRLGGSWTITHTSCVREANVVIAIGGGRRVDLVCHIAAVLEIPVLAVPIFGGTSKAIWTELTRGALPEGVSPNEVRDISVVWTNTSAKSVEKVAQAMANRRPVRTVVSVIGNLVLPILAVAGWLYVAATTKWLGVGAYINIAELLLTSAIAGSCLYNVADKPSLTAFDMMERVVKSVLISFAIILLYLADLYFVEGSIIWPATPEAFRRVSIILSLLAFASGAGLERVRPMVLTKLTGFIAGRA